MYKDKIRGGNEMKIIIMVIIALWLTVPAIADCASIKKIGTNAVAPSSDSPVAELPTATNKVGRFQLIPGKATVTVTSAGFTRIDQQEAYLLDTITGNLFICTDYKKDKDSRNAECHPFSFDSAGVASSDNK